MTSTELVVLLYFAYLGGAAWCARVPLRRRWPVIAIAVAVVSLVLALTSVHGGRPIVVLRDWLPAAYVLIGYWLPGVLADTPNEWLERHFLALDHRFFVRTGVPHWIERAPRVWLESLELSYLLCYPLVPAAFAVLYFGGRPQQADPFWTAVTLAVFSCYGLLPWLPTRPPRVLEGPGVLDRRPVAIRAVNLRVLQHGSVQWNTFPSGHAAGGVAAALGVIIVMPAVGLAFLLLALGIIAGSVLGRYHYLADAAAGVAVAVLATLVSRFAV